MIQLIACALLAQNVPPTVAFQGRLTNASSAPVNGATTITFRIYDVPAGGAALWTETQTTQVVGGVYSVHLGDVVPLTPAVLTGATWLSVQVQGDAEMTPRYRISSTPYALRAQSLQGLSTSVTQLNQLNGIGAGVTAGNLGTLTGGGNADLLHAHDWASILNKPALFPPAAHTHDAAAISGVVDLSTSQSVAGVKTFSNLAVSNANLVTNLNADLLDGLSSAAFTQVGHSHAGETWFVPTGIGLRVQALNGFGSGVAIQGESAAQSGRGVYGVATHATGASYGVYGEASSPNGWGLYTPNRAHVGGTLTAGAFVGDGSGLTNVPAGAPGTNSINDTHIVDTTRSVSLPLSSFVALGGSGGAPLNWNFDSDGAPNFTVNGNAAVLNFWTQDTTSIGTSFVVPPDYASGGSFRIVAFHGNTVTDTWLGSVRVLRHGQNSFNLNTSGGANWDVGLPAGTYGAATLSVAPGLAAGDTVQFSFSRMSSADVLLVYGVEFRYVAKQ